jgi:hypothetical protein
MKVDLFNYLTPLDWLDRLNRQYESLKSDAIDKDKALDFCLTARSLVDWDFYYRFPNGTDKEKGDHRKSVLFPQCDELRIIHDIAIGAKHFVISTPKSNISSIDVKAGPFSPAFDFSFDVSCIRIKFDDGSWLVLNIIIRKVYEFWNQYLKKP